MTFTDNHSEDEESMSDEQWMLDLAKITPNPSCPIQIHLTSILQDLFASDRGKEALADAAQKIDSYYHTTFLDRYKLRNFNKIQRYLFKLYTTIFDASRCLHYNDPRQDTMVQLIQELRNLPPKTVRIWKEDCHVYRNDPVFYSALCAVWDELEEPGYKIQSNLEKWVNFHAFIARCLASGLHDQSFDFYYPFRVVGEGLEDEVESSDFPRTYRSLAATQYVLLAPSVIFYALIEAKGQERGQRRWKLCAEKFNEIAENDENSLELKTLAKEAQGKMISVDPALFSVSEGGCEPDS